MVTPANYRLAATSISPCFVYRNRTNAVKNCRVALRIILIAALSASFDGCRAPVSTKPIGTPVQIKVPLGLPPIPIPANNPPTAETIALGRKLFYDNMLSADNSVACASCHNPQLGFTDGLRLSRGVMGITGVRNAPTIVNTAYLPHQFWDGRAISLEEQAASPIADPVEMNQPHEVLVAKLNRDLAYKELFVKAFGSGGVTLERVEKALASFERTILSGNSSFDRYQFGKDKNALTPAQVRGLAIFVDPTKGNCAVCHTISDKYALFTDGQFHNTGEGVEDDGNFTDVGRYDQTKVEADKGAFKTPTLRNVANTGPICTTAV
jgi:cytochrome c peroxidase